MTQTTIASLTDDLEDENPRPNESPDDPTARSSGVLLAELGRMEALIAGAHLRAPVTGRVVVLPKHLPLRRPMNLD